MSNKLHGIYQYTDLKTGEVVYIGKDSNIRTNRRHKDHLKASKRNNQQFNKVLQNNPDRYKYEIVYAGYFSEDLLTILEINTIAEFKQSHNGKRPLFNFTDGGEGVSGYKHTTESLLKMSNVHKGKTISKEQRKQISQFNKGKKLSDETKLKISKAKTGVPRDEKTKRKLSKSHKGKKLSKKHKKKISNATKGKNNPRFRKDIPTSNELLREYETTDITYQGLADKYNCGKTTIARKLKKALNQKNEESKLHHKTKAHVKRTNKIRKYTLWNGSNVYFLKDYVRFYPRYNGKNIHIRCMDFVSPQIIVDLINEYK